MATESFGPPGGMEPPDRPTARLPRLDRRCLACRGPMLPLAYWTSSPDHEWGNLLFGPRHPNELPMPMPMPPLPMAATWDRQRGMSLPPPPPGPLDVAPEVTVETVACADCGRLDWYVVGPRPGHEGGLR